MRSCCADIVHEVVLLGSNRPLPCLFLEIREGLPFDTPAAKEAIAQTVIQRTAAFNKRLFPYERVDESVRIHMIAINSLPRTKVSQVSLLHVVSKAYKASTQEKGNIRCVSSLAQCEFVLTKRCADETPLKRRTPVSWMPYFPWPRNRIVAIVDRMYDT